MDKPGPAVDPWSRRAFLRRSGRLTVAAAAAGVVSACAGSDDAGVGPTTTSAARPSAPTPTGRNFLVLCIDDLNDWTGFLGGYEGVKTPNMDALAAAAVNYRYTYCPVPSCLPSRAAVLWNQHPLTSGVVELAGHVQRGPYQDLLDDLDSSLPRQMAALGYETLSTGKVAHAHVPGMFDAVHPYPEIREFLDLTSAEHQATGRDFGLLAPGEKHLDQITADWITGELGRDRSTPFFAMVGLFQPHVPWRLPQWAFDEYPLETVRPPVPRPDDLLDLPVRGAEIAEMVTEVEVDIDGTPTTVEVSAESRIEASGRRAEVVQAYLAAITHTDRMVGQVLDALDASSYHDDTTVMLWSDNGYHLGEKLHWGKGSLWERSARVPLLIRDPDLPASEVTSPVSLLDLAPTVLDLADGRAPSSWEGHSLVGFDDDADDNPPAWTIWQAHRSIRSDRWRYIEYDDGGEELYDVEADPDEFTNLTADAAMADVLSRMRVLMQP